MFGIGPVEVFVVFALALIVLGPKRLPEAARYVGKIMGEVRRTTYELRETLDAEIVDEQRADRRQKAEERRQAFLDERRRAQESGELPPEPKTAPGPVKAEPAASGDSDDSSPSPAPDSGMSES